MTSYTTKVIRELSKDAEQASGLLALMNYWHKTNLANISEPMALEFLEKVRNGEIKIEG